jgi:hypothetical protein
MNQKDSRVLRVEWRFLVLLSLMIGCGKVSDEGDLSDDTDDGTKAGAKDSSVSPKEDGGGNDLDGGIVISNDSSTAVVVVTMPDGSCGKVTTEGKRIEVQIPYEVEVPITVPKPFAIYIMLDRSLSMVQQNSTKWATAVSAIKTFVIDPNSAGIFASAQSFPRNDGVCDGTVYSEPYFKNIALPDTTGAIATMLDWADLQPGGAVGADGTPMEGALNGIASFCAAYQKDTSLNPDGKKCVGVLITDGQPTRCDTDANNLIAIASNAYTTNKVTTYAVGMEGADFNFLGTLAQAGGAKDCDPTGSSTSTFNACNVGADTSAGVPTMTLLQALELVRDFETVIETHIETKTDYRLVQLDCEWGIPEPPKGESFDKNEVNVAFSPSGSGTDENTFGYVDSDKECGDTTKGWHFDNADNPTRVVVCPKTCDVIKAAEKGKISIKFGCERIPLK